MLQDITVPTENYYPVTKRRRIMPSQNPLELLASAILNERQSETSTKEYTFRPLANCDNTNGISFVEYRGQTLAVLKTVGDPQKADQICTASKIKEFIKGCNVVSSVPLSKTEVLTEYLDHLQYGQEAIKAIQWTDLRSQNTALAHITFQCFDGHKENIGQKDGILCAFDMDLILFEGNETVSSFQTKYPASGQMYLQGINPSIEDSVLEAHIQDLEAFIEDQTQSGAQIQNLMEGYFLEQEAFKIHGSDNEAETERSLNDVKVAFQSHAFDKIDGFWEEVEARGGNKEELQKNPLLMHPKDLSIAQLHALKERKDRMKGFLELKWMGGNRDENLALIRKNLDSLPISSQKKSEFFTVLTRNDQNKKDAILKEIQEKLSGPIKWNTLLKAVYPLTARLHECAQKSLSPYENLGDFFQHSNYSSYYPIFQDELKKRMSFLQKIRPLQDSYSESETDETISDSEDNESFDSVPFNCSLPFLDIASILGDDPLLVA